MVAEFGSNEVDVISVDQIAARQIGAESYLPSMHPTTTAMKSNREVFKDYDYPEYFRYIFWSSTTEYNVPERDPHRALERLFGNAKTSHGSDREMKSILDMAQEDIKRLNHYAGREDKIRLDQYYSSVRAIEKRLENMKKASFAKGIPFGTKRPDKDFGYTVGES